MDAYLYAMQVQLHNHGIIWVFNINYLLSECEVSTEMHLPEIFVQVC